MGPVGLASETSVRFLRDRHSAPHSGPSGLPILSWRSPTRQRDMVAADGPIHPKTARSTSLGASLPLRAARSPSPGSAPQGSRIGRPYRSRLPGTFYYRCTPTRTGSFTVTIMASNGTATGSTTRDRAIVYAHSFAEQPDSGTEFMVNFQQDHTSSNGKGCLARSGNAPNSVSTVVRSRVRSRFRFLTGSCPRSSTSHR